MNSNEKNRKTVTEHIRVIIREKGKIDPIDVGWERNDGYETNIDLQGCEDLSLREDFGKVYMYMKNNILELGNKQYVRYKVVNRIFRPSIPLQLVLEVELDE